MAAKRKLSIDRAKIPRSYREFLDTLKEIGEAVAIDDEVDWYLELGAIVRHACETGAPQPIFNNVKGSPGFRAAELGPTRSRTAGNSWRRLAVMLGLPEDATLLEMQDAYIEAKSGPIYPPRIVDAKDAPCKANVWVGDQVDITKLPAPVLHDGDGGRYLQTAGANVVRTPDGRWTNWSTSRAMIVDKTTMTGLWVPHQHNGMIYRMWKDQGKDCPFAIALGMPPVAATQLGSAPPEWKDEYDFASALLGEPLEMVRCETNDLLVPANCEIIIEGYVSASEQCPEGPFGEYPGYMPTEYHLCPKQVITAVTFRDNAILPVAPPGIPPDSTHVGGGFFNVPDAIEVLRQGGIPVIDGLYTFESALHWFVIRVPDDWHRITGLRTDDFIKKLAEVYFTAHVGHSCTKLIIVGEDIPPDDPIKVTWAFATRNHPELGVYHFPQYATDGPGLQLYLDVNTKIRGRGGLVAYSCLPIEEKVAHPLEQVLSFETNYPTPIQEKVRNRWKDWGFER